MKKIEVEAYSEAINCPVIRIGQRRFPGILIQGDSFFNLYSRAKAVNNGLKKGENLEKCKEEVIELVELLSGYLAHYEKVLKSNNIELPYFKENTRENL